MKAPTLYLMLGYPGAGKTTVSGIIHHFTGAVHLWADHERNKRFAHPTHSHQENLELYKQLNRETAELLIQGKSVIFDTNFNFYKDRERLRAIAADAGASCVIIWVATRKDLARIRAVEQSEGQKTRVWGNMSIEDFERIAGGLEEPRHHEKVIKLDGEHIDHDAVQKALESLASEA
jgi:predicted kinase